MAVLGPNGAGKSTLIKAVLGLMPLAGGELRVLGKPSGRGQPARSATCRSAAASIPGCGSGASTWCGMGLDGHRFGLPGARAALGPGPAERDRVDEVIERVGATGLCGAPDRPGVRW